MQIHEIRAKVEELRAAAEKDRIAERDFQYKNVLAAYEVAYENVLELFKKML